MHKHRLLTVPCALALLTLPYAAAPVPAGESAAQSHYAYATDGVLEERLPGESWRVLLDESNLGGQELEMVELTLKAGTNVASHTHQALEIIYVLSGSFGHEVNGHSYLLKPGMVGVVRPGDHVRHFVPKEQDAKVLLVWAPAGEARRIIDYGKGTHIGPLSELTPPPP
jgi:quercetin dioxygenase-like cupin family protein